MGMTAKLYSLNGLATELQRDRRTVGKALSHVAPDGKTPSRRSGLALDHRAVRARPERRSSQPPPRRWRR